MRIRSIKPEFWRSEDISQLGIEDRLLFIGLWSYVDDNGVGLDRLSAITADLFADDLSKSPRETLARVQRGLDALFSSNLIDRYEVEGRCFLHISNWSKHQRIDRPTPGRFPLPIRESREAREDVASPRVNVASGTGEQGNRGTEEQRRVGEIHPDATRLCELLADLIERNGSKRPTVSLKWLNEARLLLDKDKRPVEEAVAVLKWSQADSFWKSNILSMPKFREKYDQLRLQREGSKVPDQEPRYVFGESSADY